MIILGIDPGASGGFAILEPIRPGKTKVDVYKMPETEADIYELMMNSGADHICIESVHSMPRQGVSSTFKFGRNYGSLRAFIIASGIPSESVAPQTWQKALNCMSGGDKNKTKSKAQELYPGVKVTHAIADAMLIATWCLRFSIYVSPQKSTLTTRR